MTIGPPSPEECRSFCAKHAFKIGEAFSDAFLAEWLSHAKTSANRGSFRSPNDCKKWMLAFVCRECCETPAEGHDRIGTVTRKSFYGLFDSMMNRLMV